MAIKGVERRGMDGSRSQKKSHKVSISRRKAIRGNLDDEKVDDGTYDRQISTLA